MEVGRNKGTSLKRGQSLRSDAFPKKVKIAITQELLNQFSFCKQGTLASLAQFSAAKIIATLLDALLNGGGTNMVTSIQKWVKVRDARCH